MSILKKIKDCGLLYQKGLDSQYRKRNGVYYTGLKLCNSLMKEIVPLVIKNNYYTFFEPCVGIGNYVFSYLYQYLKLKEFSLSKEEKTALIDGIYVADINQESLEIFKKLFIEFCLEVYKIKIRNSWFKEHVCPTGCIFNPYQSIEYIEPPFNGKRFDIVTTNPPYLMLKMDSSKVDEDTYKKYQKINRSLTEISNKYFILQSGTVNLYKLFIEEILRKYTTNKALISLLVPYSLLSDKYSSNMRKFFLDKTKIFSIKVLQETNDHIQANQSMCNIFCQKTSFGKNKEFPIIYHYLSNDEIEKKYIGNTGNLGNYSTTNIIVGFTDSQINRLGKLVRFPRIKELSFITVGRGEFDLWKNAEFICKTPTNRPLIRGRLIKEYLLDNSDINEYVSNKFIPSKNKESSLFSARIACQEISNVSIKKRVKWCTVPPNFVLANTCNYIILNEDNKYGISYETLLGLLNSKLINWYFKLTSSRNHVSIFEINEFPIPVNKTKELNLITKYVKKYLKTQDENIKEKVNDIACSAYLE